jgi:phosphate/sulfate permease
MVAFFVFLGIVFGGVKLLASANNISDDEAMDKYGGKLFVFAMIVFAILMSVIGNNDDTFN